MSFFNLRRGGQSSKTTASRSAPAESLEIVRKRAKHRLIGSAVLVLLGVIGFPLLFDTQPRPVSVGIPIEIPSKQGLKPLSMPAAEPPSAVVAAADQVPVVAPVVSPVPSAGTEASAAPPPVAKDTASISAAAVTAAVTPVAKAVEKPNEKSPDKASAPAIRAAEEAARAKALLEGAGPAVANVSATGISPATTAAAGETRLVVQVGAFADVAKAREARLKLERAGLKTYTQVAETKDGKRIRVRVGPYATKAEADKAAKQIKALDLPAAILTL